MRLGSMIAFSGMDSSGKSTYINYLKEDLEVKGMRYKVFWSRGGYTPLFEVIKKSARKILGKSLPESGHSQKRDEMFKNKTISNIWFVVALLDLILWYVFVFRAYRLVGYVLVCDRYIWDTYIDFSLQYSSSKLKKSLLWTFLEKFSRKPDLSICFFVTPEVSLNRSEEKKEPFSEKLEKRIDRYGLYNNLSNKWDVVISTENASIDNTWEKIRGVLRDAL